MLGGWIEMGYTGQIKEIVLSESTRDRGIQRRRRSRPNTKTRSLIYHLRNQILSGLKLFMGPRIGKRSHRCDEMIMSSGPFRRRLTRIYLLKAGISALHRVKLGTLNRISVARCNHKLCRQLS